MAPRVAAQTPAQVLELSGVTHQPAVRATPAAAPAKHGLRRSRVRFVVTARCSYSTNTSRRTSGLRAAIVRRALAAPDGCRRPCSHSWSVRVDTPSTCANRACERPERVRASVIADTGMRWTRAALPAFISCTARSNSSPMLRLASRLRRSFSVIFDIYCLSNFLQNLAWYCLSNTLRVHREQPDLTVGQTVVADHAYTRALAFAFTRPSHLAATAGALDHVARIGTHGEPEAKLSQLFFAPVVRPEA